jgi:hypothetical protein
MNAKPPHFLLLICLLFLSPLANAAPLRIGVFEIDATPPVGSPLAYDPMTGVDTPLSCRGIILLGQGQPIVLCAVDWIGIANGGRNAFAKALAKAAGTSPQRVAIHTLHQHDAPRCDFSADALLAKHGLKGVMFDTKFARGVIKRTAEAVAKGVAQAKPITHVAAGQIKVQNVASNRRILGPDGKVRAMRWTACKDAKLRAEPVGVIDPWMKLISFWNGDTPVAALSYYATHPQSYYRTGRVSPDFPGLARNLRQKKTGVPHIHFNGAGGNIGAGKWNDGSKKNRMILAQQIAKGMAGAWELAAENKLPISADDLDWFVEPVALKPGQHLDESKLLAQLKDPKQTSSDRMAAASNLVWLRRCQAGEKIDLTCLKLGKLRLVHMPGELFIEYQLAASKMRPKLFVTMAAYGDYGPGYIGTEIGYQQGGYETSTRASRVAPTTEKILLAALSKLLSK